MSTSRPRLLFGWNIARGSDFLLGGAKKKSLAQMEKQQTQQDEAATKKPEAAKKSKGKTMAEKKTVGGITLPNFDDPKFNGELSKLGALTPYAIATQFNVRLSVARDILEELERRRLVKPVGGNARIKVYKIAAA
jgi:ribosomal protein S25